MSRTAKAWVSAVLLAITLVFNTLGAIGLINGLTQKQISDMYLTMITPGPATFSIWSVIYSLLLISVIVMIVKKMTRIIRKPSMRFPCFFGYPVS